MFIKLPNKTKIITALTLSMVTGLAHASLFTPNTTYNMFIKTGTSCYTVGADCTTNVNAATDNNGSVTVNGTTYGSSIGGDGWAGVIKFKTDATGDNFSALSYNLDQYQPGPPDAFVTWTDDASLMTGTIDMNGNMTFTPNGRMAISGFFPVSIGPQVWNVDDSLVIPTPSNVYASLTTGTSTGQVIIGSEGLVDPISLTGSALVADGNGGWDGTLVSSSNFGEDWLFFSGQQYTEVWDVSIQAVPVPAAVWLFGSGLIALVGLSRKRKA